MSEETLRFVRGGFQELGQEKAHFSWDYITITETFSTPAELRKAEREVQAYHRFRQLAQQLLEVNEKICRARPLEQELTPQKKKRRSSSNRKSPAN